LNVDQLAELECRRQVALIVRNVIIILRASKCAAPVASWFASKLLWAYKRGKKLQVHIEFEYPINRLGHLNCILRFLALIFLDVFHSVSLLFK